MAQQLRNRLHTVFSDAPWQRIAARQAQWPQNGTGRRINDIRAMVVHETSGQEIATRRITYQRRAAMPCIMVRELKPTWLELARPRVPLALRESVLVAKAGSQVQSSRSRNVRGFHR